MIALADLAAALGAGVRGDGATAVRGVRQDSRAIEPGDAFAVRAGKGTDGARFVADAKRRGAVALLVDREVDDAGLPSVRVRDVATALSRAASAAYGDPTRELKVLGVTGTNGKTTVTRMVQAALERLGARPAVLGTLGVRFEGDAVPGAHTTPEADEVMRLAAGLRARGATHLAMEVSSHALSLGRVEAVRFAAAGYTNLTVDHLDFHGTMDAYGEAKARLFIDLAPRASAILVDDAFGRALASRVARAGGDALTLSTDAAADAAVRVLAATFTASGIDARLATPEGCVTLSSTLLGAHNLANLLVALGLLVAASVPARDAARALSGALSVEGRLERCDAPGDDVTVLVDFAHTPDALARVLATVRPLARGRVWCVFGCGGDRDATKRAPMGEAVLRGADVAVVTSDNPRTEDPRAIIDAVLAGMRGGSPIVEADRARAIALAIGEARAGDLVLIAGKGHEAYQLVGDAKLPFSDQDHAKRALAARRRP